MAETTNKEKSTASEVTKEAKKSEATSKAVEKKSTAAKKETKAAETKAEEIKAEETKATEVEEKSAEATISAEDAPETLASEAIQTEPDEKEMAESASKPAPAQDPHNHSNEAKDVVEEPLPSTKVEQVDVSEQKFPITHVLTHPVTIYRAPAGSFAGRSFGGVLIITGEDVNGFTPVKLNRSGIGIQTAYVRTIDLQ